MRPRRLDKLFRRNTLHLPPHQFQFILMRYSFLILTALFAFTAQGQTTFNVDMTCAPEGFTDVFVTGPWCGWCANDVYNTMTDDDGDGIYSVTLDETVTGLIEYKYAINGFADQENLINDMVNGASCAPVTDFNAYANRQIQQGSIANDSYGTCDGSCNDNGVAPTTYDVTFRLDVSGYSGSVSSASMFGTFSGWEGNGNPMSDVDGDGIYELTLSLEPGLQEYKYRINFSADESFDGSEACTTPPAEFVNRVVDVVDNATLDVVCWNSCDACGDGNGGGNDTELPTYDLTFNLNMANENVSADGVFLAGGAAFGEGWLIPAQELLDLDGDGIYSLTLQVDSGFSSDYTFVNGIGWGNKENIAGQDCAVPPYNDRRLDAMSGPVTINTCFAQCTDDGSCGAAVADVNVTFNVDISEESFTDVYVFGSFNGWSAPGIQMLDADADGIHSATVPLAPGNYEFKFLGLDGDGNNVDEVLTEGDVCTINGAPFVNRTLEVVAGADASLEAPCFGSCSACAPAVERAITFQVNMSEQATNPIGVFIAGNFQGWQAGDTPMTDDNGDDIWEYTAMIAEGEAVEYKFINGPNWGLDESVPVACAVNGNRGYTVGGADEVLPAVCFASCTPCGDALPTEEVTFTVLTDNITVAEDGMYLAGAMNGWGGEAMMDNGDGSWSITKSLEAATYEFKFQNGLDGWEELDCGGNRSVEVVLGAPIAYQGCFAQCADVCAVDPDPADVTFQVDASQIAVSADGMFLMGSFTEPAWQLGAIAMNDDDGDNIWTATVNIDGPAAFQYKFNNGLTISIDSLPDYSGEENADFIAGGCGVNNGVGGSNRLHERSGVAETLDVVCFNSCEACVAAPAVLVATVDLCGAVAETVRLTGPFWGWDPNGGPVATDNGDGTWSVTFDPAPGENMEYLWIVDGTQENLIQAMVDGGSCAPVTDFANYANRLWELGGPNPQDVYNSCSACEVAISGCTDPSFLEFDPYAASDDGSCTTLIVYGCIYQAASNYNSLANVDDNSCEFDETSGCQADLDGDGAITTSDLLTFLASFGQTCL